ncbi:MAG: metallophosphatase family protein [Desulfurococcales archaeon]|nr:metallophosphatase family protein [Desulfurococcales archaeon]
MKVLVISDIHGNSIALKEVIKRNEFDELWVLGDLVDYGPDPGGVIDLIKELKPKFIVRGNHDHAAAFNVDCGCGPATHELSTVTREKITLQSLSKNELKWLSEIPLTLETELDGSNYYIVHGSPSNPLYGYLYYYTGKTLLEDSLQGLGFRDNGENTLVHGHTHYQGSMHYKNMLLINPGSVGQPRDGDSRAAYLVIEKGSQGDRFILGRIKYDIENVVKQVKTFDLPEWAVKQLTYILRNGKVA